MNILPMLRSGAIAALLATAALVQGCSSPGPVVTTQQSMLPDTGVYSGAAWYQDLENQMTSQSGD